MRPVIALLTDFGLQDHYVGTMKGVALGICPDVTFVDLTHEIAPQDVLGGALQLAASYRYFPAGTIFLVVVDPGVGSARRALAVETDAYRFVAPDNGVLSLAFDAAPPRRIVELTERRYARPDVSRTFEGRDRFAPAAAWLASGVDLGALGPPLNAVERIAVPAPAVRGDVLAGEVLRVDRFGNLMTNIDRGAFDAFAAAAGVEIAVDARPVPRLVATYGEVAAGEACALFGSSGRLEVSVNGGSAARAFGAGRGAAVHVRRRA